MYDDYTGIIFKVTTTPANYVAFVDDITSEKCKDYPPDQYGRSLARYWGTFDPYRRHISLMYQGFSTERSIRDRIYDGEIKPINEDDPFYNFLKKAIESRRSMSWFK